jgi:hypothetical protein
MPYRPHLLTLASKNIQARDSIDKKLIKRCKKKTLKELCSFFCGRYLAAQHPKFPTLKRPRERRRRAGHRLYELIYIKKPSVNFRESQRTVPYPTILQGLYPQISL